MNLKELDIGMRFQTNSPLQAVRPSLHQFYLHSSWSCIFFYFLFDCNHRMHLLIEQTSFSFMIFILFFIFIFIFLFLLEIYFAIRNRKKKYYSRDMKDRKGNSKMKIKEDYKRKQKCKKEEDEIYNGKRSPSGKICSLKLL